MKIQCKLTCGKDIHFILFCSCLGKVNQEMTDRFRSLKGEHKLQIDFCLLIHECCCAIPVWANLRNSSIITNVRISYHNLGIIEYKTSYQRTCQAACLYSSV